MRSIHVVVYIDRLFLFIVEYYSTVWIYMYPMIWIIPCFWLLQIVPALSTCVCVHVHFSFIGVEWLDQSHCRLMVNIFRNLPNSFPERLYHFLFPSEEQESSTSFPSFPTLGMVSLLNFIYFNSYIMVSCWSFYLINISNTFPTLLVAILISSFLKCGHRFFTGLLVFSLLNF